MASQHVVLKQPFNGDAIAGVLRSVVRGRNAQTLPSPRVAAGATLEQRAEAIAIATSHPTWMVTRWLARYGQVETVELLAANNRCRLMPRPEGYSTQSYHLYCSLPPRRSRDSGQHQISAPIADHSSSF